MAGPALCGGNPRPARSRQGHHRPRLDELEGSPREPSLHLEDDPRRRRYERGPDQPRRGRRRYQQCELHRIHPYAPPRVDGGRRDRERLFRGPSRRADYLPRGQGMSLPDRLVAREPAGRRADGQRNPQLERGVDRLTRVRLLQALSTLVDENQRPAIDGIWEDVVPPTQADLAMVKTLAKTFDPSAWLQEERTAKFKFDLPKDQLLLKYLFEPTVNICGIYSGYIEHGGTKTVLPQEAYAKIDIRLVKAMTVEATLRKLRDHLKKRGYDDLRIEVHGPYGPAKTDPESWIAKAAIEAVQANGKEPEVWPSSGGTMPAFAFDEYLKLPWVSTGLGHGSRAHAPNEYASIDGMKRFMAGEATLLYAAAKRAPKRHR